MTAIQDINVGDTVVVKTPDGEVSGRAKIGPDAFYVAARGQPNRPVKVTSENLVSVRRDSLNKDQVDALKDSLNRLDSRLDAAERRLSRLRVTLANKDGLRLTLFGSATERSTPSENELRREIVRETNTSKEHGKYGPWHVISSGWES